MRRILLFWILTSAAVNGLSAQAKNYYVDSKGNDLWDGGRTHPWKTVDAVSRARLVAGDSIFFRGGQVFSGTLRLSGGGSWKRPVWIGCYGDGKANIDGGDSSAVVLYRVHWMEVSGLRLVGAGRKTGNVKDGLAVIECDHILVKGVDIAGFQKTGLFIYASKYVVADGVYAHENGAAGISVEGPFDRKTGSTDLKIVHCRADDNPGDPTNLTNHSGNGIVCGHCTRLLIEFCSATNNGWDMPRIGNGPVGIWCYEADSVIIRRCLAFRNKTSPGAADGGGFDLDGGVTNSIIEQCLSYGNQGAGYCLFQYWGASPWYHNIIRDNISEDDGGVSDGRAGIYVWNSSGDSTQFYDCDVYNNSVYNSREAALSYSEKSTRKGFRFYDNIFVGADSLIRGNRGVDRMWGNDWWVLHGNGRSAADAAEHGKSMYVKPAFRDPGNTKVTSVAGMVGYDKYALPAGWTAGAGAAGDAGGPGRGRWMEDAGGGRWKEDAGGGRWMDSDGRYINAHGAGVLFQDGVYYLFGEIKKGPTRLVPWQNWEDYRVEAGGVSCYSSRDLVHWKNEGIALAPETRDTASDLYTGRVIERPKVIYDSRARRYVMWMHIDRDDYGYARAGVAVASRPAGPYTYLGSFRPNGQMSRDMTVFKDPEDGRAYLVYASENNNTMQVCLLSEDYLKPATVFKRILIGQRREAPAVFKSGGQYYLITSLCSGWDPNAARYAVADSMLGEWKLMGNPCAGVDSETTFHSQSTYVLPMDPASGQFLFMADRWNKTNLEGSGYLWLPLWVRDGHVEIRDTGSSDRR